MKIWVSTLLATTLFITFGLVQHARAIPLLTIADSVTEFSGVQGQDSWFYGQANPYDLGNFALLENYTGVQWEGTQSFSTPTLSATGGVPGVDSNSWAVRRWISDYTGTAFINSSFYDLGINNFNAGTTSVRIFLNQLELFQYLNIPDNPTQSFLSIDITQNDIIDFTIDSNFMPSSTYFVSTVSAPAPVPQPSTFLLLGSGFAGLAFVARRRKKK